MNRPDPVDVSFIARALEKHEAALVHYVYRLTHDLELARDVVQDAFLKLLNEDQKTIEGHLTQWLYQVCRNKALDIRKKERRMRLMADEVLDSNSAAITSPIDDLQNRETHSAVLTMLDQLPVNQQEVIRLKFQQGLSYKQISSITQLSVTNVGFLIHTGIKTLRQKLTGPLQTGPVQASEVK